MCNEARTLKYDNVMKKSREMANSFTSKIYDNELKRENKLLINSIQDIFKGKYRSVVPRRATSLANHKLKSLRGDAMRLQNQEIKQQNISFYKRMIKIESSVSRKAMLEQSQNS